MKKILVFVLGLVFIGSTIIPFSEASRNVYHAYMMQQAMEKEKNTRERKDKKIYKPFETITKEKITERKYIRNTMRRPLKVKIKETKKEKIITNDYFRASPYRSGNKISSAWTNDLQKRETVVFKNTQSNIKNYQSYQNNSFIIQIPQRWEEDTETKHFFSSKQNDFTISIKKIYDCQSVGFTTCAINISKEENKKNTQGKLTPKSNITRQAYFANTIQNSRIQTRALMEGFSATRADQKEQYIARLYIADIDGGIYVIETQSSLKTANSYILISKQIFDSFRILPAMNDKEMIEKLNQEDPIEEIPTETKE